MPADQPHPDPPGDVRAWAGSPGLPADPADVPVEVVRSSRRRKTVQARYVDGRILVSVPARMSRADTDRYATELAAKVRRQLYPPLADLEARARILARRHDLPRPSSIRWVDNQQRRWGSCTPATGTIRISSRIAGFPAWVVDAVVVHELAHLVEPGHGSRFRALVDRYPLTERATGYLIAKGLDEDDDLAAPPVPAPGATAADGPATLF